MITWGHNSEPHEWPSRIDRAISAGFDPGEDYGSQTIAAPGTWPSIHPAKRPVHRWAHQSPAEACADCGTRCDYCDDRMCTRWGPAPEPSCGAHNVCEDCAADHHCRECQSARANEREAS